MIKVLMWVFFHIYHYFSGLWVLVFNDALFINPQIQFNFLLLETNFLLFILYLVMNVFIAKHCFHLYILPRVINIELSYNNNKQLKDVRIKELLRIWWWRRSSFRSQTETFINKLKHDKSKIKTRTTKQIIWHVLCV